MSTDGPGRAAGAGDRIPARGSRTLLWATAAVGLAAAGVVASVWRPVGPALPDVGTDLDRFGAAVLDAVHAYRGPRRLAGVASAGVAIAVPVAAIATARGRRAVERLAERVGGTRVGGTQRRHLTGAAVAAGLVVAVDVAVLPLDVAFGYVHAGEWGFRTSDLAGWVRDWFVANGVGWVLAAAAGAMLVWLVGRWPRSWPWRAAVAGTAAAAALALAGPALVDALWLRTEPLPAGQVRDAVEEVLARADMSDAPILVGDASRRTSAVNAFVHGLGPSVRVVLYDNLLELPADRVAAVVAHEIAHWRHQDLLRGVLLTGAGLLPSAWAVEWVLRSGRSPAVRWRGPGEARVVAVAVAVAAVAAAVSLPLGNAVSRRAERAADHAALELTQDPATAVALYRTFVVRDLADPRPPAWTRLLFGTHPTVAERIRRGAAFAALEDLPLPPVDEFRADETAILHPRAR